MRHQPPRIKRDSPLAPSKSDLQFQTSSSAHCKPPPTHPKQRPTIFLEKKNRSK